MSMIFLQPPGWASPKGYANGVVSRGRQVHLAGQIGWDAKQQIVGDRLFEQVRQALRNVATLLTEAGGGPQHLVRLTWFITSRDEYLAQLKEIGAAYRDEIGRHFPPMSVVQVVALVEARAKVEIEATAVIPEGEDPPRA
jgi:enamine deaminase RidA (YjgF/YER057c/UK114 family)